MLSDGVEVYNFLGHGQSDTFTNLKDGYARLSVCICLNDHARQNK